MPDTLEYLAWQGKEKRLYRLVREEEGGKVQAVLCESPRKRDGDEEGEVDWMDWMDKRILDY